MKISISTKLYILIVMVFLLMTIFGLIFNGFYIEKLYIKNSETLLYKTLDTTIKKLNAINNLTNFDREQIESETGIKITIIEKKDKDLIIANTDASFDKSIFGPPPMEFDHGKPMHDRMPGPPPIPKREAENIDFKGKDPTFPFRKVPQFLRALNRDLLIEASTGKLVFRELENPDIKSKLLIAAKIDNNENVVIVSKSILVVKDAVKIASDFYTFASFVSLIIGIIFIFFLSKKITKPILEINRTARSLAKLNFEEKVKIVTGDELEELGNSINTMSLELDNKIKELNTTNHKLLEEIEKDKKIKKMLREFISNVSHEFKTPLAIISGYAEGLRELVNIDKEKREKYSTFIISESEKMSKMVNELLEISKLESDIKPLIMEDFNLYLMLDELIGKVSYLLKDKNIFIELIQTNKDIYLNGNLNMVERAITNVISNAIKFVNENGSIRISVFEEENFINIDIENSGEHIPEDKIESIWLPFYKVEESRKRDNSGTGLGLTIVKGIMERHNGRYEVKNTDFGVKFSLLWPIKE